MGTLAGDEDRLPLMGSGIDLTKVPAIQQKRTVAFLNQFVVHTVQFLNRFSTVCKEKPSALSLRIQQIETTLNILDAKLSSILGLEDVKFEISTANVNSVTNGPEATPGQQSSLPPQSEQNNTQGWKMEMFLTDGSADTLQTQLQKLSFNKVVR
ncbi:WASH complex subunit 3-like [Monodelphis domestica]|uniref:WASH complex subunit 3-like n=1 Tax=Monodelphis domestica TaxID=13616 RepID=UPI0024E266BC|nr:WASH complex subunit 3-like [Monodelphis domestica]